MHARGKVWFPRYSWSPINHFPQVDWQGAAKRIQALMPVIDFDFECKISVRLSEHAYVFADCETTKLERKGKGKYGSKVPIDWETELDEKSRNKRQVQTACSPAPFCVLGCSRSPCRYNALSRSSHPSEQGLGTDIYKQLVIKCKEMSKAGGKKDKTISPELVKLADNFLKESSLDEDISEDGRAFESTEDVVDAPEQVMGSIEMLLNASKGLMDQSFFKVFKEAYDNRDALMASRPSPNPAQSSPTQPPPPIISDRPRPIRLHCTSPRNTLCQNLYRYFETIYKMSKPAGVQVQGQVQVIARNNTMRTKRQARAAIRYQKSSPGSSLRPDQPKP